MKNIFSKVLIFLAMTAAFSALTGCGGNPTNTKVESNTAATDPGNSANPNGDSSKKSSEFPPLAEKAANAEMKNLDGSISKVVDMKGKVLLLNMWATWCGPCRGEMPALVKMQEEHRDKGFEIIGLNTDDGDSKEMIDKFAEEMKLNYKLVWAPTDMQAALLKISNFGGIPQSFIIDRDGKLRGVFRGGGDAEVRKMGELVAQIVNEQ
jgi:thiol-disulfide isomerase/thioredoxin